MVEKLRPFINGNYVESKTDKYSDIYDPSTGEVIAQAPICTHEEVEAAVKHLFLLAEQDVEHQQPRFRRGRRPRRAAVRI